MNCFKHLTITPINKNLKSKSNIEMNCFKHLTITPINKNLKSKSNIDFREQCARTRTGELNWCWDDSRYNKAKSGEYFAYLFYNTKVIIHKIIAVKPPTDRLPSWSENVGQTDRNVVELSEPLIEFTWQQWLENDGPESHLGTYTTGDLSESRPKLYNILKRLEENSKSLKNKALEDEIMNIQEQMIIQNQLLQQQIDAIKIQMANQNKAFQDQINSIQQKIVK